MRAVQLPAVVAFVLAAAAPCLAQSLESRDGVNVAIEKLAVDAKVDEGVALVDVDETFRNGESVQREGVWRFRLPADAVVSSFSMWMNGAEKTGRVLEAGTARRVYDSIVAKRKDPGLLEQTGWRDFQVSVFPIPAKDTVRIRLRYAYVLPDDLGLESLEVPLPVGCGAIGDLRVRATFTAARGLATLDCPSHKDAKVACDGGRGDATWSGDGVVPAGPFVVRAVPKRDGFDVAVVATRPPEGGDGWFVARVVPRLSEPPKIARDVVFVVDRSGSMQGVKMDQARAALLCGLDSLKPGDRFDVISFSSDVTALGAGRLLAATPENLERARSAARDISASGGTNIAGALGSAVALRSSDATRLFAVVFLTDGIASVGETNEDRILAAWRENAGATRLFAFGVGADVKDFLLTKLAAEGRGTATYVRSDADLEVKLSSLVDSIRTPLLVDPDVSIDGDGVEVLDREPRRLPDVFQGRALVVSGRFRGAGRATLHLRGRGGATPVDVAVPLDFSAAADRPHVAQIWAKQRVERLLDDLRATGANAEIRAEIVRLGVRFQIVSPYTSFLVVEDGVRIPDTGEDARVPDQPGGPMTAGGADSGGPSGGGGGGGPTTGGGGFGGPRGEVPPETREPSDPPPPSESGGPSTPGGDTASVGGGGGPSTGSSGAARKASRRAPGYEDWTFWWQYAWDDVVAAAPPSPRAAATPETLAQLRALLRDASESFRVRSSAALALAAMDDADVVPDLLRLASAGSGAQREVAERSVLALGLLRHPTPQVRAFLTKTLHDTTRSGDFGRAFAAVALGLARDDSEAAAVLRDAAGAAIDTDPNFLPACLVAVGVRGDPSAVPTLLRIAASEDERRDAFAVDALGRIGLPSPEVVDALVKCLDRRTRASMNARRSAPGALARIAVNAMPDVQRRIVAALAATVGDADDVTLSGRAAIALGRFAGDVATDAAARGSAIAALERALDRTKAASVAAYAAVGLGLSLHAEPCGVQAKQAEEIRARLRAAFAARTDRGTRSAYALGLGLARDASSSASLAAVAADTGEDERLRGFALLASVLAGAPGAADAVRAGFVNGGRYDLALEAAAAAADPALAKALVAPFESPDLSARDGIAIARALGRCGDASTVEALRAIVTDTSSRPDAVRASAVLAIGRLCGDFGPLARVTGGLEFRAYVPALADLLEVF